MSFEQLRALVLFLGGVALWAFGLSTVWNKLIARVNGLGGRTKKVEEGTAELRGHLDELKEHATALELRLASENVQFRDGLNRREMDLRVQLKAAETRLDMMYAMVQQLMQDERRMERDRLDRERD